jgi:thioredoxin
MSITAAHLLELSLADDLVIADFQAEWCGPCKTMAPIVKTLDDEFANVKFVAIDIDADPLVASEFAIQSIPTFVFFSGGQVVDRVAGAMPATELRRRILAQLPTPSVV